MSISAKERLEFVFSVVDGLVLEWRRLTLKGLILDCCDYLDTKRFNANQWQEEILNSMNDCLLDKQNQKGVAERLTSINLRAEMHPEKGALVTDLARRALTGELREGADCVGIKEFSVQMERVFTGDLDTEDVWSQEWQRVNARFNTRLMETL